MSAAGAPRESPRPRGADLDTAPGYRDAQRAQAALWLLEQIDGEQMIFDHPLMGAEDLKGWCRIIAKDAIAGGLAEAAAKITGAVHPPVHPPLGEPVLYGTRGGDCPVCGAAIMLPGSGSDLSCDRCDALLHYECYWGRVVSLAEWQDYVVFVNGGPDEYDGPPTVCAQCRAKAPTPPVVGAEPAGGHPEILRRSS